MSVSESEKECPLCMEALDWDDLGFFPCSCGYQICRFCWHRLRTDENGLCPACRQAFPELPVSFNPEISAEELKKQKKRNKERRSNKDQVFKPQDLATLRVVQKNLVFVIGLSSRLTQEDLKKEFAHFGKIIKFVHNKSTAYITYSKPEEAIRAIRTLNASAAHESAVQQLQFQSQLTNEAPSLALTNLSTTNSTVINNTNSFMNAMSVPVPPNRLKASLGTTKYCNHFLRSQQCPKVGECMYLHEIAEAEASFTKEQMQAGKHVEYEKKLMDSYLAKLEWQANLASQNNGYRVSQNNLPIQQINNQHQTLAQQISSQLSANQLSPSNQSQTFGHRQPNANQITTTITSATIPTTTSTTNNSTIQHNSTVTNNINNNNSIISNNNLINNNVSQPSTGELSPNHLTRASLVSQTLLQQQQSNLQSTSDHSPNQMIRHQIPLTIQSVIDNSGGNALQDMDHNSQSPNLMLAQKQHQILQQQQRQQHSTSQPRQQQPIQQSQLVIDTDSEDDGLDFDPISVSTSGLRDLLDQQVQQAKQLQMQSYFQQMNSNQSLANVLFQQSNRLSNQNLITPTTTTSATSHTNGLLSASGETTFNGLPQSLAPLAGLTGSTNQQQQVNWQNLSAWTNFFQRSGYGFENGR